MKVGLETQRELEGIDVSNIVSGGRRRRGAAAAAAPAAPATPAATAAEPSKKRKLDDDGTLLTPSVHCSWRDYRKRQSHAAQVSPQISVHCSWRSRT